MKHIAAGIVLALTPLTLAAQSTGGSVIVVLQPDGTLSACPIGMRASQGLWDHAIAVKRGLGDQKFGQRIILTLNDAHPARVVAATVKVHGLTGKSHMLQTAGGSNADSDAARILQVRFAVTSEGSVSGDLYVPGFTSVSSVELQQVSYADGSTWNISVPNLCRVTPNPMMLIAAQ